MAYGKNLKVILKMRYKVSDAIAIEEHEGVGRTSTGGRVSLRPLRPDYAACLYAVYASTRTEELAVVDWDEAQKAAFLHQQFTAQHQFYQERYTQTDFLIMLRDAVPVGCLSIARWQDESRRLGLRTCCKPPTTSALC